jgi:hypothetical protein
MQEKVLRAIEGAESVTEETERCCTHDDRSANLAEFFTIDSKPTNSVWQTEPQSHRTQGNQLFFNCFQIDTAR